MSRAGTSTVGDNASQVPAQQLICSALLRIDMRFSRFLIAAAVLGPRLCIAADPSESTSVDSTSASIPAASDPVSELADVETFHYEVGLPNCSGGS